MTVAATMTGLDGASLNNVAKNKARIERCDPSPLLTD